MTEGLEKTPPKRGRLMVAVLFLVFFAPVLLAWLLNVERPDWLPSGRTNHGDLIQPPVSFPLNDFDPVNGQRSPVGLLSQKWSLVHVVADQCLDACDQAVHKMRQIRLALGKDMDRIQRILVASRAAAKGSAEKFSDHDADVIVVAAGPRWFSTAGFLRPEAEIYLVDPRGNVVMSYTGRSDPSGLVSDLERLLRISKIG